MKMTTMVRPKSNVKMEKQVLDLGHAMVATYLFAMSASISLVRLISGAIQLILTIVPKPATYPNQSKRPWHPSYGERRMDRRCPHRLHSWIGLNAPR